ncbi:ABC transporter permease [Pseudomonas typographi]|uniref:ABC transporter permease n=1 Tax=Pseudomonas typographi TaxID=2715964 RepID=A0ABR7Z2H0_9PSED|nr:ABC transporter permease [Pseudomonas typographi]MBD1585939.1 ABC transporter permease [Pseudomonas typographi]MBD1599696.1 ABC transporter permease [Pseudomonas typographi]
MDINAVTLALFLAGGLRLSVPVLLAALGELVSERAGVFTIGLEGLMLFGAVASAVGLAATGSPIAALALGMLGGLLAACVLALGTVLARANQIVMGIGFNVFALGVTSLVRQLVLVDAPPAGALRSVTMMKLPWLSDIPVLGRALFSQSPVFYFAVLLAVALWLMLRFTRLGLLLRAVGENAAAADAAGQPVLRLRFSAAVFTGLLAGLGGAYLCIVASGGTFIDNMTAGRGYLAIAIAIFARWMPLRALLVAVALGLLEALQFQGQYLGIELPAPLLMATPFAIALVAWIAMGRAGAAPADLGRPFLRGEGR